MLLQLLFPDIIDKLSGYPFFEKYLERKIGKRIVLENLEAFKEEIVKGDIDEKNFRRLIRFLKEQRVLSFNRHDLNNVLKHYSIHDLIGIFKQDFAHHFSCGVGVWEGYTLEQHIILILTQFDRYFSHRKLPEGVSLELFRVLLVVHDLGKPEAVKRGNKNLQHQFTIELVAVILKELDFSDEEINIGLSLIDGDPIGQCVKGVSIDYSISKITDMSRRTNIPINDFFDLLIVYYKCDAGSYTEDSGGIRSLDSLFIFDHANRELKFSPPVDMRIESLRKSVLNNSPFNSEIDWAKWNKEIPENFALLKEYYEIEKSAKANNIWMKNLDDSSFTGTPEQFVQQRSKNFKKAFPQGYDTAYRGAHQHVTDFKNRDRNDYAAFFTDNFNSASTFSSGITRYYDPNVILSNEWIDGVYQIAIPKNFPRVIGEGEKRSWRLLNWDGKIAKGIIVLEGKTAMDPLRENNEILKNHASEPEYGIWGYDDTKKYLSTDIYANYIKNPENIEGIFEIRNVIDVMGNKDKHNKPHTVFGVDTNRVPIKSLRHNNGMFDMRDPNIYK